MPVPPVVTPPVIIPPAPTTSAPPAVNKPVVITPQDKPAENSTGSTATENPPAGGATPTKTAAELQAEERQKLALSRARRVEAENRQRLADIQSKEQALQKSQSDNAEKMKQAAEYERLSKLAQKIPLEFIKAAGLTEKQLLEQMAKGSTKTPEEIAQAIVNKTLADNEAKNKAEREQKAKQAADELVKTNQAIIDKTITQISEVITKEPEKFELCQLRPDAAKLAYGVLEKHYSDTYNPVTGRGEQWSFGQALTVVETYLESEFDKFTGSSKKLAAKKLAAEEAAKKAADEAAAKKLAETPVVPSKMLKTKDGILIQRRPEVKPSEEKKVEPTVAETKVDEAAALMAGTRLHKHRREIQKTMRDAARAKREKEAAEEANVTAK